ncbi:hypothetical protein H072_8708 [Dactylellina haptotyla CBS 200.50]|uniref:F-box domain-containing protein n=1 Tax=Dactylellina haptotyla (strain CBS 200.50) TaxID=1284197 RepID=S8A8Z2_DACHA|nr:hypothetical protein H072_8708 [Dactylellina haptotyla CBS 200.50]
MDVINDAVSSISLDAQIQGEPGDCESRLLAIPPEVLLDIVSYLDNKDLLKFARVCKRANGLAVPRLYETVLFSTDDLRAAEHPFHSLHRKDIPNRHLRHVRNVGVMGTIAEAGFWLIDLPGNALENISSWLGDTFEKFLHLLEPNSLRGLTWKTELIFSKKLHDYLNEYQRNIDSIVFGRLSAVGPIELLEPTGQLDLEVDLDEWCCQFLERDTLIRLDVQDIRGPRELQRCVEVINKHRKTLKHLALEPTDIPNWTKILNTEDWNKSTLEHAGLQSLDIFGFELKENRILDLTSLLGDFIKPSALRQVKILNSGFFYSMLWSQRDLPKCLTTLHLDIYGSTDAFYKYIENKESAGSLAELRLAIRVKTEERFPNLQHHEKSLQRLFLIMVSFVGRGNFDIPIFRQYPIPMSTIHQLMAMPNLEELAITIQNPTISPIEMNEGSFPKLRVFWVLAVQGLIPVTGNLVEFFDRLVGVRLEEETTNLKTAIRTMFKPEDRYPKNLEVIAMLLKDNQEYPYSYFVRGLDALAHRPTGLPRIIDESTRAFSSMPSNSVATNYPGIKIFKMVRAIWREQGCWP